MRNMNKKKDNAKKAPVKVRRRDEVKLTPEEEEAERLREEEEANMKEETDEEDPELRGKTWEEQLAILEKSDESDLELIRNANKTSTLSIGDAQWKLLVGVTGSGLAIVLVIITL